MNGPGAAVASSSRNLFAKPKGDADARSQRSSPGPALTPPEPNRHAARFPRNHAPRTSFLCRRTVQPVSRQSRRRPVGCQVTAEFRVNSGTPLLRPVTLPLIAQPAARKPLPATPDPSSAKKSSHISKHRQIPGISPADFYLALVLDRYWQPWPTTTPVRHQVLLGLASSAFPGRASLMADKNGCPALRNFLLAVGGESLQYPRADRTPIELRDFSSAI